MRARWIFICLTSMLTACVSNEAERAMLATSPEEAVRLVRLDPEMKVAIARAVEGTHPLTRALTNKVLVSEISDAKYETSYLDRGKFVAHYCVNVTIERPLLDWHRVFTVYPIREDGRFVYRVKWQEKDAGSCGPSAHPFPELKSLYERAT